MTIDQNKALRIIEKSLIPGKSLIDGRSEMDRLNFLVKYASVINFYDRDNKQHGNWIPFLLKDPIFLLAYISKTKYADMHGLYLDTCQKLDFIFDKNIAADDEDTKNTIGQLIDQLIGIFKQIERWTYYMQNTDKKYDLKKYVIDGIKFDYSPYFWAILGLQDQLIIDHSIKMLSPVIYKEFESYDEKIWKEGKNVGPYWKVLELITPDKTFESLKDIPLSNIYASLTMVGDKLFDFLKKSVLYSVKEFNQLKKEQSKFPDTVLLRVFVNLLEIQQQQLNAIAKKHLKFYYRDILKQRPNVASPDTVLIAANLAKTTEEFELLEGTLFDAGLDKDKNPILFESEGETNLNPAAITDVYTLYAPKDTKGYSKLLLKKIPDTAKVKKDANGKMQTWSTFGAGDNANDKASSMGLAFGSPMLLLKEGKRKVTLTLTFTEAINFNVFTYGKFYFSTETNWLEIPLQDKVPCEKNEISEQCVLTFNIDASEASIEAFKTNPDGLDCSWPMFKIAFDQFYSLSQPPVIKTIQIDVEVDKLKSFQLYNDQGSLSTAKPFKLFGSAPDVSSNFIIGSSEIFSKPFNYLVIQYEWDKLPDTKDFSNYYNQYNKYLDHIYDTVKVDDGGFWHWLTSLGSSQDKDDENETTYNNTAFRVDFRRLEGGTWSKFDVDFVKQTCDISQGEITTCTNYDEGATMSTDSKNDDSLLMYGTGTGSGDTVADNELNAYSFFCYQQSNENLSSLKATQVPSYVMPNIQNLDLKYSDKSMAGFMKMSLFGPPSGFGGDLYAKVVSAVSLYNAASISRPTTSTATLEPSPNPPYIPTVNAFTAKYSATIEYELDGVPGGYPIQCFSYSLFQNYMSYDSSANDTAYIPNIDDSINSDQSARNGVILFPSFKYNGSLFIGFENLVAPGEINLYFELARQLGNTREDLNNLNYSYLSTNGWKKLNVLSDGTNNFSCPGIIKINTEENITTGGVVMPSNRYWFSISVVKANAYAETAFLTTNGIQVTRAGTSYVKLKTKPKIESNVITKTYTAVPQITSVVQPFPSYGGTAAETKKMMNRRVSTRLKTKGRLRTSEDYFRMIKQKFLDVYYCKTSYNSISEVTTVYVVKEFDDWTDPNAFTPLVSTCTESEIHNFVNENSSPFSEITVSNFNLEFVVVNLNVTISSGLDEMQIQQRIGHSLDLFLSPWIKSDESQVSIDTPINTHQIIELIKNIDAVLEVTDVSFLTYILSEDGSTCTVIDKNVQVITPRKGSLFVSSQFYDQITFKTAQ